MDIDVKNRDGVIVLKPCGKLIGAASNEFRQVIQTQLQDGSESSNFLFDFTDCAKMDSSSIGALVGLHVSIAQKGGEIGVINLSNGIKNSFVTVKLINIFKHFNSETEAIANLQQSTYGN